MKDERFMQKGDPLEGIRKQKVLRSVRKKFIAMTHVQVDHAVARIGPNEREIAECVSHSTNAVCGGRTPAQIAIRDSLSDVRGGDVGAALIVI